METPILVEGKYGHGAVPDKYDSRDYQWSEIGKAVAPFDWNVGYDIETVLQKALSNPYFRLPVKNQGGSSSCGGQAWGQYTGVLEALSDKGFEERSAKYIYAQTYTPGGGSYGRDNCNICVNQGVAREQSLTSYDKGEPPGEVFMERSQDITAESRTDAVQAKEISYVAVNPDIESVAQAIKENGGCIIGITGNNNGTWASKFPLPPTPDTDPRNLWRHWVYCGKAKYLNGKKYVAFLNSWGPTVGEGGWQYIGEDYFNATVDPSGSRAIFSGWTMIFDEKFVQRFNLLTALLAALKKLLGIKP